MVVTSRIGADLVVDLLVDAVNARRERHGPGATAS